MDFTLDQLLAIVGRLDDAPGFDTPRERYRRFLVERMQTLDSARPILDQCREHSGEQSHRALQDAVVLFGRFLGFETSFDRYQHDPGETPVHGTWLARHRLRASVIVCTDQTIDLELDVLSREVAESDAGVQRVAVLVVSPLYAGRDRLDQAVASGRHPNIRVISLNGLVRFAAMAGDGNVTHQDVLQVFAPPVSLDARIDFLERIVAAGRAEPVEAETSMLMPEPPREDRRYWVNMMSVDPFAPAERLVQSLIGTRQILGINPAPGLEDRVRPGDAICVFVAARGIVAHAQIAAILRDGSKIIRDAKRFTHVLRLTNVIVYDTPVVPAPELARKLDLALTDEGEAVTASLSPREFEAITTHALSEAG